MILFYLLNMAIIASAFVFWAVDKDFFSIPYLLYHSYPIFLFIATLIYRNKVKKSEFLSKIIALMVMIVIWLMGVVYIFNTN